MSLYPGSKIYFGVLNFDQTRSASGAELIVVLAALPALSSGQLSPINELNMLDFRLAEMSSVVDYFVLVEATKSHSNRPKKLFYADKKGRFAQYEKRIIHVVVDDMPNSENAWELENHQRACISTQG